MPRVSVQLRPTHRPSVLSAAQVTIELEDGTTIEINDCRVMRNRQGILWAALPSYSVTAGKQYEYHPSVVLSPVLHREVTDAILAAYEAQAKALPSGGGR
jgi:DNA-binding cell septation regulator SpoVG